jgi:hypothetical protein
LGKIPNFWLEISLKPKKGGQKRKRVVVFLLGKAVSYKEEELVRKKSKCGGQKESKVCCLLVGKCSYKD